MLLCEQQAVSEYFDVIDRTLRVKLQAIHEIFFVCFLHEKKQQAWEFS